MRSPIKKTLQYHYISDKSEHAYSFEQNKSELKNLSKLTKEKMTAIYLFKKFDFAKGIPLQKSNFLKR